MSNFLIFKAAFNNSATPAIGTYTVEGGNPLFNINASLSPDYYLYNTADDAAVQWFVPTAETTDFEFVADILTRQWTNRVTYFIIADSTGTTRLRMWSRYDSWKFENSDSTAPEGDPEYIGGINATTSGGFNVFHQFRVRVRKLTASSSSVEVYVDGTLKLTATAGASLITCAKMGFVGGVNTWGPGTGAGIKNAYVYDLSDGDVVNPGVLSGAFNRFISWTKSKFALKSDIPTVNDATLTIQQNGTNVQTFTANQSTNATANIQCVDLTNNQTVAGNKEFTGTTTAHDLVPSATDTYNFGSSTAQWKSVYAQTYYYNGTAWGLNKANMWTDTNTFSKTNSDTIQLKNVRAAIGEIISSDAYTQLVFKDKSTDNLAYIRNSYIANGTNNLDFYIRNKFSNESPSTTGSVVYTFFGLSLDNTGKSYARLKGDFYPYTNNLYSLGTSTNQWNNAYIKSLTINGVACGDILTHNVSEFVDISSNQTIGGVKTFSDGVVGNVSGTGALTLQAKNGAARIYLRDDSTSNFPNTVNLYSTIDGKQYGVFLNGKSFHPVSDDMNLGTSSRKWKTFNGINPGALSLPSDSYVNVDTTNWVLDGSNANIFTPASDGWLGIQVTDTVYDQTHYIFVGRNDSASYYQQNVLSPINALWDGEYHGCVFIPVAKNFNYDIRCICSTIVATFYPCQGNA